jgi:hypothetical protein
MTIIYLKHVQIKNDSAGKPNRTSDLPIYVGTSDLNILISYLLPRTLNLYVLLCFCVCRYYLIRSLQIQITKIHDINKLEMLIER